MKRLKSLAYLTIDGPNADAAEKLASQRGWELEIVEPRDLPRLLRERTTLIVDWDFITDDERSVLLNGSGAKVVAIHSYNVSDEMSAFLRRRGIQCSLRLDGQLFDGLSPADNAA